MTIKELYDWALENAVDDYEIKCYSYGDWRYPVGTYDLTIDEEHKEVGI